MRQGGGGDKRRSWPDAPPPQACLLPACAASLDLDNMLASAGEDGVLERRRSDTRAALPSPSHTSDAKDETAQEEARLTAADARHAAGNADAAGASASATHTARDSSRGGEAHRSKLLLDARSLQQRGGGKRGAPAPDAASRSTSRGFGGGGMSRFSNRGGGGRSRRGGSADRCSYTRLAHT